jgi:hypothetical protein
MNKLMFSVGFVIFILYMWGLITMINQTHGPQSKKSNVKSETDRQNENDQKSMND